MLEQLPDPVIVTNAEGRLTWANQRAIEAFGVDVAGGRNRSVADFLHPDDVVTALASVESVQLKAVGTPIEVRIRDRSGSWVKYEARGWSGLHDPHVRGIVAVLRKVDDRGRWDVTGGDAGRLAAVLEWSPGLTMLLDRGGRVLAVNRAFSSILGRDVESTLGRPLPELVVDEQAAEVADVLAAIATEGGSRSFEATLLSGGTRLPTPFGFTAVNLLEDADVHAIVVSGIDIASLVESRAELAHRATHDPLTGLPNRVLVLERLDLVLRASVGTTACVGLVFCDIDGFKAINDAHGHGVGDDVLVEVARRIHSVLRRDDTAGRLGGDEMVVIALRDTVEEVEDVVRQVTQVVADPIETSAGPVRLTLSAGSATARHGARADDLLRRADAAMYAHKRARHDT
ncbi:MAG TPA: diguanylate cyclase [Acidimicrobiales bacterium]|nr:diguanylate cyclase [Acidimicrobiales bacterium]